MRQIFNLSVIAMVSFGLILAGPVYAKDPPPVNHQPATGLTDDTEGRERDYGSGGVTYKKTTEKSKDNPDGTTTTVKTELTRNEDLKGNKTDTRVTTTDVNTHGKGPRGKKFVKKRVRTIVRTERTTPNNKKTKTKTTINRGSMEYDPPGDLGEEKLTGMKSDTPVTRVDYPNGDVSVTHYPGGKRTRVTRRKKSGRVDTRVYTGSKAYHETRQHRNGTSVYMERKKDGTKIYEQYDRDGKPVRGIEKGPKGNIRGKTTFNEDGSSVEIRYLDKIPFKRIERDADGEIINEDIIKKEDREKYAANFGDDVGLKTLGGSGVGRDIQVSMRPGKAGREHSPDHPHAEI